LEWCVPVVPVRTGLLAVGAAMAIVGAGVVAAITMPFAAPDTSRSSQSWDFVVPPESLKTYNITATPGDSASVRFAWNSTVATKVVWYSAGPCSPTPNWCVSGILASWNGNTTGKWTVSGVPPTGYRVQIVDSGSAPVSFSGQFVESVSEPSHHLPMVPFAFVLSGGSILIGLGGLSIYLGLFLPSGTFGPRVSGPSDESDSEGEPAESAERSLPGPRD